MYTLDRAFWDLEANDRSLVGRELSEALSGAAESVHIYHTFGTREQADAIVWSTVPADEDSVAARFFERYEAAIRPFRRYLRLVDALWGFTRDSEYSRGAPSRGIDALRHVPKPYLVVYPFAKTHDWYRVDPKERGRIMREHIQLGRKHEGIDQLLLYSTGLQDHEFVVVYETDDLEAFSTLVSDLRVTEARGYTLKDAPVQVGFHVGSDGRSMPWR
jgi:chlorite dismutase